jgi:aldose 1-epimerase
MAGWHHGRWHSVLGPLDGLANDPKRLLMHCGNRLYVGSFRWRGGTATVAPGRPDDRLPLHGDAWLAPWQLQLQRSDERLLTRDALAQGDGPSGMSGQGWRSAFRTRGE